MRSDAPPRDGDFRCGIVAVIGRPNVGKSTLVNALIGERLSITSSKPQTTRHSIRGILTTREAQYVFADTPGFQSLHRNALNRAMNRSVRQTLEGAAAALLVIEAGRFGPEDRAALATIPSRVPRMLAINKIDRVSREELAAFLAGVGGIADFADIV